MNKKLFNTRDITTPKNGLVVYKDAYWICEGDATKALFFGSAPQCNKDKRICESTMQHDMYKSFSPNIKVIFVETAFVPQRD